MVEQSGAAVQQKRHGEDTDTGACIAGAIAQAYYGEVAAADANSVLARLDDRLRGVFEEGLGRGSFRPSNQPGG